MLTITKCNKNFKLGMIALAALMLSFSGSAFAQFQWQYNAYDEFNGASGDINHSNWIPENGYPQVLYNAPTNPEAEGYCTRGSSTNYCVSTQNNYGLDGGGHLFITAINSTNTRTVTIGTNQSTGAPITASEPVYNSGRLSGINDAAHQLQYGRIEARIQVPLGYGAWPAFWLLGSNYQYAPSNPGTVGWPQVGEIDILENWSVNSNSLPDVLMNQGSVHGPESNDGGGLKTSYIDQGATYTGTVPLDDDFHTYAIEWIPGQVSYYVDGVLYGTRSPAMLDPGYLWELDGAEKMYPVINLAVGTTHTGTDFPSGLDYPNSSTPSTLPMVVDYVRHYTYMVAHRNLPPFYGNADIGGPGPNSSAGYSSGTFTVTGSGKGLDLTTGSSTYLPKDQFQYVYRPLTADGTYSVKVSSQTGTLSGSGAGIMIRDGRAAFAQFVTSWISESGTVHFTTRVSETATDSTYGSCGPYVRIVKSGTSLTGGCSTDGTHWTTTGTASVTFSNHEVAGLTSFAGGNPIGPSFTDVLNTATFTNLNTPSGRAAWDGNAPKVPQPEYKSLPVPTLIQAENFDVGGQGVAYNTTLTSNLGQQYRPDENISIYNTTDFSTGGDNPTTVGGYMVGDTQAGQWMNYTINVVTAGTYTISTRVASDGTGGTFHFNLDGANLTNEQTVPNTDGWDTWTTITSNSISLPAGIHTLGLAMDTVGSTTHAVGNFDLMTIQ